MGKKTGVTPQEIAYWQQTKGIDKVKLKTVGVYFEKDIPVYIQRKASFLETPRIDYLIAVQPFMIPIFERYMMHVKGAKKSLKVKLNVDTLCDTDEAINRWYYASLRNVRLIAGEKVEAYKERKNKMTQPPPQYNLHQLMQKKMLI